MRWICGFAITLFSLFVSAQTLAVGSADIVAGSAAQLNITLAGGAPSTLTWKMTYEAADFDSIAISNGAAATAGGKSLNCFHQIGSVSCALSGMNSNTVADGVVAIVTLRPSVVGEFQRQIQLSATAASPAGEPLTIQPTGGVVSIVPPPVTCPCSIWDSTTVPETITDADTGAVELGMKFQSKIPGYIVGLRFYKGPENKGTHQGRLWTNGGAQIANVIFRNETPSGWQQAYFAEPVAIEANKPYVVSYRAPGGRYSINRRYFRNAVESGPLVGLKDGVSKGNGVYRYGSPQFPNSTYDSSNYWVDPIFNTVPSTTPQILPASLALPLVAQIETTAASKVEIAIPEYYLTKPGESVSFRVAARDAEGRMLDTYALDLPAGATFTREDGRFHWMPMPGQRGEHRLTFLAMGEDGAEVRGETKVTVGWGPPRVTDAALAACSPGAISTLRGEWLARHEGEYAEPAGASYELGGTRVRINGELAPILFVSRERIDFLCPVGRQGSALRISVETPEGASELVEAAMQDESFRLLDEPKVVNGRIEVRATGLRQGSDSGTRRTALSFRYQGVSIPVSSTRASADEAGVTILTGNIPSPNR